ncbi:uncharacterized protein NPIL_628961 [Nephila pilipes]|uniref:Uncharacterized protein n=1 Tax=Nephila pilipes TaxID=299642 RepID=A0A8X6QMF1_NEPPI|nr:uncharacterized protein NPIL_628961 [Nephila pilipes]
MDLRKWRTNSLELRQELKKLSFEIDEFEESLNTKLTASKVLGVGWNKRLIHFILILKFWKHFFLKEIHLLQVAGRLFDQKGFIGPCTIRVKCLIQEIWCLGLDWDDQLCTQTIRDFLE